MTMSLALHSCSALVTLFIYDIVLDCPPSSFLLFLSCVLPALGSVFLYYNVCGGYTTCIDLILDCSALYLYQYRFRNSFAYFVLMLGYSPPLGDFYRVRRRILAM